MSETATRPAIERPDAGSPVAAGAPGPSRPWSGAPLFPAPRTPVPPEMPGRPYPPPGGPFPPYPPFPPPLPPIGRAPRRVRRTGPALLLALTCLLGGATAGAVAGHAAATPEQAATQEDPVARAAAVALPSTVQIVGPDSSGSGIVLSAGDGTGNGTILTNAHVVDGGGRFDAVFSDGTVAPLQLAGSAPRTDLAVLRVSGEPGLRPAQLGDSRTLLPGDTVIAIGEPLGFSGSVTRGVVSALGRAVPVDRGPDVLDTFQTDAAINHGSSGGPVVDTEGRVVGITSRSYAGDPAEPAESLGFAIPIEHARRIADELTATGRATLAGLPATLDDIGAPGALVTGVTSGSAAAAAGLRAGDVVTRFGGKPITAAQDLTAAVQSSMPGSTVEVVVTGRDGTSRTLQVPLDTMAA